MGNKVDIDMDKLHPWMKYKLNLLLKECDKKKMYIVVTCGYRSAEEQDELYAKGRSKRGNIVTNARGGYSQHNWGIAVDIAMRYDVDKDGKVSDDTWNVDGFGKVAKLANKIGLGWGGDWTTIKDRPHFYLTKWGSTPSSLIKKYGTFAKFKKTWTGTVKCNTYLRKTKLFNKKVILTIPKGKKVSILWTSKLGYAKVEFNGKYGYIRTKNLK